MKLYPSSTLVECMLSIKDVQGSVSLEHTKEKPVYTYLSKVIFAFQVVLQIID